jgi:hypothetical protein
MQFTSVNINMFLYTYNLTKLHTAIGDVEANVGSGITVLRHGEVPANGTPSSLLGLVTTRSDLVLAAAFVTAALVERLVRNASCLQTINTITREGK